MNRFPVLGVMAVCILNALAHDSAVPHTHSVDPQTPDLFYAALATLVALGIGAWVFRFVRHRGTQVEARTRSRRD
jgi:hypothetical protein